jgi:ring-1,2-phenylacetyl-CoA epoxidase subunit PaaE
MSSYLAEQLSVGESLDVLPPNGSFTPRRAAQEAGTYVAFASGCGITPVLSVIRSLLAANKSNRVILFYGNANTGRAMCLEELLGLKDSYLERLSLHFLMSREPQEVELYNGRIDGGRVRQLAQALFKPGDVTEFFVCGPGNMIDEVSATLRELGVAGDKIHGEHFTVASTTAVGGAAELVTASASGAITVEFEDAPPGAISVEFGDRPGTEAIAVEFGAADGAAGQMTERSSVRAPGTAQVPAADPDQSEVTVLMDGRRRTFTMRMNDEVVLDAAARAGLELPFSCRAGVCSTCRTKLVRGEVEMVQNYALEEWEVEQGYVLACQARVKTPVLELDYDEK